MAPNSINSSAKSGSIPADVKAIKFGIITKLRKFADIIANLFKRPIYYSFFNSGVAIKF
ncbi:hypothetical protein GCM10027050_07760 [Psychrosphaera aestuarii]